MATSPSPKKKLDLDDAELLEMEGLLNSSSRDGYSAEEEAEEGRFELEPDGGGGGAEFDRLIVNSSSGSSGDDDKMEEDLGWTMGRRHSGRRRAERGSQLAWVGGALFAFALLSSVVFVENWIPGTSMSLFRVGDEKEHHEFCSPEDWSARSSLFSFISRPQFPTDHLSRHY